MQITAARLWNFLKGGYSKVYNITLTLSIMAVVCKSYAVFTDEQVYSDGTHGGIPVPEIWCR